MRKVYNRVFALADSAFIRRYTIRMAAKNVGVVIETHEEWASKHFGVPIDEVTQEQRMFAKRMRFGVVYGTTMHGAMLDCGGFK